MTRVEVDLVKELYLKRACGVLDNSVEDRKLPVYTTKKNYELTRSYKVYEYIELYTQYNIKSLYGLTLPEFLQLNRNEISMLITHSVAYTPKQATKIKRMLSELEGEDDE